MTTQEVEVKVCRVIGDTLGVDDEELVASALLRSDLGCESIELLDIRFRLEKLFIGLPCTFFDLRGLVFEQALKRLTGMHYYDLCKKAEVINPDSPTPSEIEKMKGFSAIDVSEMNAAFLVYTVGDVVAAVNEFCKK